MNQSYQDLVVLLTRGISQRRLYFEDHPRVFQCGRDFSSTLERLLEKDGKDSFFIGVTRGKLIHDGKPLIGPSIIGNRMNSFAELLGCGGFLFKRGISTPEVLAFFTLAAKQKTKIKSLAHSRKLLAAQNLTHVELSPPFEDANWFGRSHFTEELTASQAAALNEELDQLLPAFQALYSSVEDAHQAGHAGQALDIVEAQGASSSLISALDGPVVDLMQMVEYPDYDTYTVGHSVRVAMFAVLVARHLGLPESLQSELGAAALLHDVGKSRIPDEILYKPGRLDAQERVIIETHAALGAELLLESGQAPDLAVAAAWGHHRRFDRQGYPGMPYGSKESPLTDLINVCDVFEALTAIRPYKEGHTARQAYEIMFSSEGWFNPVALSAFCRAVGLYPVGSQVELTSGHRAQVIAASEKFDRPRVKLTHGPDGQDLPEQAQSSVDLSTHPSGVGVRNLLVVG